MAELVETGTDEMIVNILRHRARMRDIGLNPRYRRIRVVGRLLRGDFQVNRHEIIIARDFGLSGTTPFDPADEVLDVVEDLYTRDYEQRVRAVVHTKSEIMKWAAYLERVLSVDEYSNFIRSLNGKEG